ncbi:MULTISPECIES: DUF2255 family protein [unclassified Actinotalea]|uniref:DUF2255 family protein n=1 Tax=unclassified Actinotalea TaxID=2638618 RepID=UPI0015F4B9D5|nr:MULTISPECIES: DUF2255 family protein [unclassified Actinotalea]
MTTWHEDQLSAIDREGELQVAALRPDGTPRNPATVWHVAVDGDLFIRSVRGESGAWYRAARRTGTGVIDAGGLRADVVFTPDDTHDEAIDQAYHVKYGDGSAVRAITSPLAAATTLRVEPR